jgi:hypothetical protein
MISAWRKSSKEFRGCQQLPPPPPLSMPRRSLCHILPSPVGRNDRQDSSSTNNVLNNNSRNSLTRRRRTTMAMVAAAVMVAVGVAPPTPLPPRVRDPPTSTPGPTLFRCGQVPRGSASSNPTYVRRLCRPVPFPTILYRRSSYPSCRHSCLCPFTMISSRF